MGWTRIAVLTLFLVIMFTVSAFGPHIGYTVDGVPQAGAVEGNPVSWTDSFSFFGDMVSFQIDGFPAELSAIFIIMAIISIVIAASFFLPGGG